MPGLLDFILARFRRDDRANLRLDGLCRKRGELAVEEPDVPEVDFARDALIDELDESLEEKKELLDLCLHG